MLYKWLIRITTAIGEWIDRTKGKITDKLEDKETGTIMNPNTLKSVTVAAAVSIFLAMSIVALIDGEENVRGGLDKFEKEKEPKFKISKPQLPKNINLDDPLANIEGDDLFSDEVTISECEELLSKVKNEKLLTELERKRFDDCLDQGMFPELSEQQKKVLRMLADPDSELSPETKKFLTDFVNGVIAEDDPRLDYIPGLLSSDPLVKKAAAKLIDGDLSEAEKKALEDFIKGKGNRDIVESLLDGTPEERANALKAAEAALNGDDEKAQALVKKLNGEELTDEEFEEIKGELGDNKTEQLKNLGERIKKKKEQASVLKSEIDQIRDALKKKGVFNKLAEGKPLTPEEQALFDQYNEKRKKLKELEESLARDLSQYKDLAMDLKRDLQAAGISTSDFESAVTKFVTEKPKVKKDIIIDSQGRQIPASEYRLLQKLKRQRELASQNGFEAGLSFNVSPSKVLQDSELNVGQMVVWQREGLKNYNLPMDLRVPAVVESSTYVSSDDSANRRVIIRLLDNIYDPETNDILFSKGSKSVCLTQNFDVSTKLMQLSCNKLISGYKTFDIAFSVMDHTGKMGIPGGVLDTRGKKITSAMLTEFAAGVVDFFATFSQQQQLANGGLNIQQALTGASLSGAGAGMQKISEALVQDLQNSPSLFYSPKGLKVILMPN